MTAVPPPGESRLLIHGTTVAMGHVAAVLRGPSGSGKSDLALRFLAGAWPDGHRARALVSDDQTMLTRVDGRLIASAPSTIAGKLEVRGLGIVGVAAATNAEVRLVVDLVPASAIERMPDPAASIHLLGHAVRLHRLCPFEPSAPLKLALLLRAATDAKLPPRCE